MRCCRAAKVDELDVKKPTWIDLTNSLSEKANPKMMKSAEHHQNFKTRKSYILFVDVNICNNNTDIHRGWHTPTLLDAWAGKGKGKGVEGGALAAPDFSYTCNSYVFKKHPSELLYLLIHSFIHSFRTWGHVQWFERERDIDVRKKNRWVDSRVYPNCGLNPQPRHVPWPGIELATFWCMGQHSNQMSQLPSQGLNYFKIKS